MLTLRNDSQVPHHSSTQFMSCCNRPISTGEEIGRYNLVSSADSPKKLFIESGKSLTYMMKSVGPSVGHHYFSQNRTHELRLSVSC